MNTNRTRMVVRAAAFFAVICCWVGSVSAQMMGTPAGVGGNPPTGPFVFDNNMAMVMDPTGGPIPIYMDPSLPPWIKTFQIPPNTTIIPGEAFSIWEKILIVPPPTGTTIPRLPLTDWHEHIHEASFNLPFIWAPLGHLAVHDPLNPSGPPIVDVHAMVEYFVNNPGQSLRPFCC